jgi:cell fate regulator YaaT (PSP1 superfamily)
VIEPAKSGNDRQAEEDGNGPAPVTHGIISKGPQPQFVEVRFKGKRSDYYTAHVTPPVREREYVVVEADRGQDLGQITATDGLARRKCAVCEGCNANALPGQRVLRRAAPVDVERALGLRSEETDVRREVRQMVTDHNLKMKISDSEWQWDRNKLIIYFTADKRVDFRVLVRSLAKKYRTRIELKQIGVRDEARRLDGVGRCGRELCLRFEHDFYVQARKRFPKEGRQVLTLQGDEWVVTVNIFASRVTLRTATGALRTVTLDDLKKETAEARRSARNS